MSIIKVKRGLKTNLPTSGINVGELFFTTDTYELFVGKSATTMTQIANLSNVLEKTDNLNSLSNKATSRTNLDVYSKGEIDSLITGMNWSEVMAASTVNLTLSGEQTIDGENLTAGDRVLVKDQTDQTENGIYVVASGSWTRATDADSGLELATSAVIVDGAGTVNGDTAWLCSSNDITIGTTDITYIKFPTGTYIAGEGLALQGNQFRLDVSTLNEIDTIGTIGAQGDKIIFYDAVYEETVYVNFSDFYDAVNSNKVKFDAADSSPGFIGSKIVGSDGIVVGEGTGSDENKVKVSFSISEFSALSGDVDADSDIVLIKDATDGVLKTKSVNGVLENATIDGGTF